MYKNLIYLAVACCLLVACSPTDRNKTSQSDLLNEKLGKTNIVKSGSKSKEKVEKVRVMFYNVENLFDTTNDPKNYGDDEYTPASEKQWTQDRYTKKLKDLGKVIFEAKTPDLIGLGEVENRKVVEDLTQMIGVKNWGIVHKDSPDERGIDVAFIYNKDIFTVTESDFLNVNLPKATRKDGTLAKDFTRDVLYLSGKLNGETVHVFVNHWPSRRRDDAVRVTAAKVVDKKTKEILTSYPEANIILMGDFNDEPDNISMSETLNVKKPSDLIEAKNLYNIGYNLFQQEKGTYNYKGDINLLDHIIVSGSMLKNKNFITTKVDDFTILERDFMIFEHPKYGKMASRTYGSEYYGGISDHFPVYTDLYFK